MLARNIVFFLSMLFLTNAHANDFSDRLNRAHRFPKYAFRVNDKITLLGPSIPRHVDHIYEKSVDSYCGLLLHLKKSLKKNKEQLHLPDIAKQITKARCHNRLNQPHHPYGVWIFIDDEEQVASGILQIEPPDHKGIIDIKIHFLISGLYIKAPTLFEDTLKILETNLARYLGDEFEGRAFIGLRHHKILSKTYTVEDEYLGITEYYTHPSTNSNMTECTLDASTYTHLPACNYQLTFWDRLALGSKPKNFEKRMERVYLKTIFFVISSFIGVRYLVPKMLRFYENCKKGERWKPKAEIKLDERRLLHVKGHSNLPGEFKSNLEEMYARLDAYIPEDTSKTHTLEKVATKEIQIQSPKQQRTLKKSRIKDKTPSTKAKEACHFCNEVFIQELQSMDPSEQYKIKERVMNYSISSQRGSTESIKMATSVFNSQVVTIYESKWGGKDEIRVYFFYINGNYYFIKIGDKRSQVKDIQKMATTKYLGREFKFLKDVK